MKYSETPWTQKKALQGMNSIVSASSGESIAVVRYNPPKHDDAANAERIVACVNACEGITTESLESGLIKHLLKDAFMRTLNPFDRCQQRISDMTYLGKPIYEEDFEEDEG
jgi:hypothetical protein